MVAAAILHGLTAATFNYSPTTKVYMDYCLTCPRDILLPNVVFGKVEGENPNHRRKELLVE